MTSTTHSAPPAETSGAREANPGERGLPTRIWWLASGVALIIVQIVLTSTGAFPTNWYVELAEQVNRFQKWSAVNRLTNPLFTGFFDPLGDAAQWLYELILDAGLSLPWFWLPLLAFAVVARTGRWGTALFAAVCFAYGPLVGLSEQSMQTVALSLVCVLICVAIGAPIAIWVGTRPHADRIIRPIVDALQSLPVTLYLGPAALFLGIGVSPAIVATVIFAVGPLIRIMAFGIRDVPAASVEAGQMFGSTPRQLLWKVRVPQAVPAILTGLNQTIMAALSMVVVGALVGAGGLGAEVFQTLTQRSPGRGLVVGLAIVAIAIAFDRCLRSLVERPAKPWMAGRNFWFGLAGLLAVAYVVGRLAGWRAAPWTIEQDIAEPIDDLVVWIRDTFGTPLQSVNDFVVGDIAIPIRDLLGKNLAWPVVIGATALLSWRLVGWRLAVFAVLGLIAIGLLGRWSSSIETLAQLLLAVALAISIAIPVGIFLGTRPRLETAVGPLLETLQTLPSVIYAIPFTMIFAVGYMPGILSTALYAIPAGVRLAALAVRRVDQQSLEASTMFGATGWQRLIGVRVPMAFDGIMLGVNQVIMMSMSMVLITGLTGSQGLGYELVSGLRKPDVGLNLEAGITIVIMGILLDRLSHGLGKRLSERSRSKV